MDTAAACNWLVPEADGPEIFCRCCCLTRTLPDLSVDESRQWWRRIAMAQRRLLSTLVAPGLPTQRHGPELQPGLSFDLLRQLPCQGPVVTGHADGVITLDVAEADDAQREQRRHALQEPCRALFGDEREDHAGALQRHDTQGPPVDWRARHVSAYASSHPWEDWAEIWAHYLHLVDTLDTARGFGLDGEQVALHDERWRVADLAPDADGPTATDPTADAAADPDAQQFVALVNGWMALNGVLNELSRGMGLADFYPLVLTRTTLRKLHLVHGVVQAAQH